MKRILICDNSGYANYSVYLCNALTKVQDSYLVNYLTDDANQYLEDVNNSVVVSTRLNRGNSKFKRRTFLWFIDRLFGRIRAVAIKISEIRRINPDIIIFQSMVPIYDQFLLSLYKRKAKVVFTVHNVIPHEKTIDWSMRSLKRVYKKCDFLIVHSEENQRELLNKFSVEETKTCVINHGISLDYIPVNVCEEKQRFGINDNKPILLAYGGIREYKGLDILIKACKGIDCHLIIAGKVFSGYDFSVLSKLIAENEIDATTIIRFISSEETNALFQISDFIMLPYKEFHSQSGVFMQSIQYKKPVIASDVSSFRRFVEKYKIGYICEPNNVTDLHNTILTAIDSANDFCIDSSVRDTFSWENSAKEYIRAAESVQ